MNDIQGTVFIVDDDAGMRKGLARLCQSVGLRAKVFESAREFLGATPTDSPACLLLDLRMPGLSGLDLQAELAARDVQVPIVFISGHGDIPASVQAMKAGAVDFLTKPFKDKNLVAVIRESLAKDIRLRAAQGQRAAIEQRLRSLTPREREVFDLVIKGLLNKQIAAELGTSEQTVKVHRGRVMEKMQVESVAELVQAALVAGVLKAGT
jgi:RNA polymerase sigma factor (sigma-70 family)